MTQNAKPKLVIVIPFIVNPNPKILGKGDSVICNLSIATKRTSQGRTLQPEKSRNLQLRVWGLGQALERYG